MKTVGRDFLIIRGWKDRGVKSPRGMGVVLAYFFLFQSVEFSL